MSIERGSGVNKGYSGSNGIPAKVGADKADSIEIFKQQHKKEHLERSEWKGWQVALMVVASLTILPGLIYLLTQHVHEFVINKHLLGGRSIPLPQLDNRRKEFMDYHRSSVEETLKEDEKLRIAVELTKKLSSGKLNLSNLDQIEKQFPGKTNAIFMEFKGKIATYLEGKQKEYPKGNPSHDRFNQLLRDLRNAKDSNLIALQKEIVYFIGDKTHKEMIRGAVASFLLKEKEPLLPQKADIEFNRRYHQVTIPGAVDDVPLDGFEMINPKQKDKPVSEQKWIVCFVGKDDAYENQLDHYQKLAATTGANILAFNYRGVGRSGDRVEFFTQPLIDKDLIADGLSAIEYLKQKKVPIANITAVGHSQGGAVAAEIASMHPGMRLAVDRTFTTFDAATREKVGEVSFPVIGQIVAEILANSWSFNTLEAYKKVQEGHKIVIAHKNDNVILGSARLDQELFREAGSDRSKPVPNVIYIKNERTKFADEHNVQWDKGTYSAFAKKMQKAWGNTQAQIVT